MKMRIPLNYIVSLENVHILLVSGRDMISKKTLQYSFLQFRA